MAGWLTATTSAVVHAARSAELPQLDLGLDLGLDVGWSGLGVGRACFGGLQDALQTNLGLFGSSGAGEGPCGGLEGVGFAVLALVALVTIALGRMRLQTESKRLDVAQRLLEQGIEPPASLLMGPARNDLRRGIVLACAGLGLLATGLATADRGLAAGACIPVFIGVGYLVSFFLAVRVPKEPDRHG